MAGIAPIMDPSAGDRSGHEHAAKRDTAARVAAVHALLAVRGPRVARAPRAGRAARAPWSPPRPFGRTQTRPRRRRVWGLQLDEYSHDLLLLRGEVAAADVLEVAVAARELEEGPVPIRGRGAPAAGPPKHRREPVYGVPP